jgi:tetratricopeptide (TPR) repeat protein
VPASSLIKLVIPVALIVMAGCATRPVVPAVPTALEYPEFLYPAVPAELQGAFGGRAGVAGRLDNGWRFLQNDDLGNADREFAAVLQRASGFYPAQTGAGYVAMARGDQMQALTAFDAVLDVAPRYVPALVGRGQALLALNRDADALAVFEAAIGIDGSLVDLRRRVDVLRFRSVQDIIERARAAAAAGRLDAARAAYGRAIDASPQSAFLHRELGIVERKAGNARVALDHFRRATELDAFDAASLVHIGELLEQDDHYAAAEAAYRKAADIEPSDELSRRIVAAAARARESGLPGEFRAIPDAPQVTRGDLAALIGVRLESVLREMPGRQVVITDTLDHWAAPWIARVAAAGVIVPFENHTFQPTSVVRRVDLARAVSQLVRAIASRRPDLRDRLVERPKIADMTAGHLDYPAVSLAVASGAMPLDAAQAFRMTSPVSGAQALDVIARLQALAAGDR